MAASLTVDPYDDATVTAARRAFARGPSPHDVARLMALASIAARVAMARVRFTIIDGGVVERVSVDVTGPVPERGDARRMEEGSRALAEMSCVLAPFANVPVGTSVTFRFDGDITGADAGTAADPEDAATTTVPNPREPMGVWLPDAGPARGASPAPWMRSGTPTVGGQLSTDEVVREVRSGFGRFRGCYEAGLKKNPKLEGRIAVTFTITESGSVAAPMTDPSTTLPDPSVVACAVSAFRALSFPRPASGVVRVTYPVLFAPPP